MALRMIIKMAIRKKNRTKAGVNNASAFFDFSKKALGDKRKNDLSSKIIPIEIVEKVGVKMEWDQRFNEDQQPLDQEVSTFIANPLWEKLINSLQTTYQVEPKLAYSSCSMGNGYWKGWNLKFKKGGKSLCTVYPKAGYFTVLISLNSQELADAEVLLQFCDDYTKRLYQTVAASKLGKALSFEVTNEKILQDVLAFADLRAGMAKKKN
ncbi:DUF3788 domain-containing protein [Enterococcus devriesei]